MKKKILIFTLIATLLLSLLVSCGSGAKQDSSLSSLKPSDNYYAEADMANGAYGFDYEYKYDAPETEIAVDKGGYINSSTGANNGSYTEKIIKNINITAQTKEYEKTLDSILASLKQLGGYEESVESTGKGYNTDSYYTRRAYLRLRIPAENLDAFLAEAGTLMKITSQNSSQSNVTSQYYDIKARNEVLEAERIAYEEMLKKAVNVEELLLIKDRLYKTIEEIEANKTTLQIYDNKVSFSTVTITLNEVKDYVEVPTPKTTFATKISNAFTRSWRDFANGCQDLAIWFVESVPTLLVLAVIFGTGAIIVVKTVKKRKNKNQTREEENK